MQKKVLALHDLSGCGRSSLVPIISLLTAAGHECIPLPTAVFSTHTAIPGWIATDLTDAMRSSIEQYDRLNLRFDAIYPGFLASARQIEIVLEAIRRLKSRRGIALIDPVMGDNGRIYQTYTPEICDKMQDLCRGADIITPNVTEAAILLGLSPTAEPETTDEAIKWMRRLYERFSAAVVLTGLRFSPDGISVGCYTAETTEICSEQFVGGEYPGTGDIFSAVLLGRILYGVSLPEACAFAGAFVKDCIAYTAAQQTDPAYGIQFEKLLQNIIPLK